MSRIFRSIHGTKPASLPNLNTAKVRAELIASAEGSSWDLVFNASVPSSNKKADPYLVRIACRYKPTLDSKDSLLIPCLVGSASEDPDHAEIVVSANRPTTKNKFRVSCSCQDYIFTYMRPNAEADLHWGELVKLPKPSGTGAPRNPEHKTGCCRHIFMLREALLQLGHIKQL